MARVFVKLNDTNSVFSDFSTGFTIVRDQVKEVEVNERVSRALKNGHLRKATEEEIKAVKSQAEAPVKPLSKAELAAAKKKAEEEEAKQLEAQKAQEEAAKKQAELDAQNGNGQAQA